MLCNGGGVIGHEAAGVTGHPQTAVKDFQRINCRLVKTGSEQGHTLFWERPRPDDGK
jgi:hypothetical protein